MLEEIAIAGEIVEKDATVKVARERLSVLEMAETLGNISEACRRGGIDQTGFYKWKRCFKTHGGGLPGGLGSVVDSPKHGTPSQGLPEPRKTSLGYRARIRLTARHDR